MQPRRIPDMTDFDLNNEDGFINRRTYLNTREERIELLKINEKSHTTPTTPLIHGYRVFARIITMGGIIGAIPNVLLNNSPLVSAILLSGLILDMKDKIVETWDPKFASSNPIHKWAGTFIILICFNVMIGLIFLTRYAFNTALWNGNTKARLRRARFEAIEAQLREIDNYSPSYSLWYNEYEDDPDIAITIFRSSTIPKNQYWFNRIKKLYFGKRQ